MDEKTFEQSWQNWKLCLQPCAVSEVAEIEKSKDRSGVHIADTGPYLL